VQVTLSASSCSLAGEGAGAAGGEGPSEGARPRDAAQAGTRVGPAALFEDLLSLHLLTTPTKVRGRKMDDRLGQPFQG